jgi:uncharacterized protein (DUF433 family)
MIEHPPTIVKTVLSRYSDGLILQRPVLGRHKTREDIRAALAYAAELAHERVWKVAVP